MTALDWSDGPVRLMYGDARDRLAALEPESVQCVVTSPPYWGLRDYGTASWEGGDITCPHATPRSSAASTLGLGRGRASHEAALRREAAIPDPYKGDCGKCGAKRVDSQLGLEPTPDLYVAHMADIFAAVARILRRDGTLWLNLGDSYATTTKGSGGHSPKQDSNAGSWHGDRRWQIAAGLKPKDLVGIPWRVAFALQAAGWYLRSDIIWSKPNPMPESVQDRPTKAHEYLFLLTRSERYYYNAAAIREPEAAATVERYAYPFKDRYADVADAQGYRGAFGGDDPKWRKSKRPDGWDTGAGAHGTIHRDGREAGGAGLIREGRNKRSVWEIPTQPYAEAHFATFPEALVEPCILAGTREGDVVLDPFAGSGTTLAVARRLGRRAVGVELQPAYLPLIQRRVEAAAMPLTEAITDLEQATA